MSMPEPQVHASSHPLVAHKLAKLRSVDTTPKQFRELLREIAALLTYEATQDLQLQPVEYYNRLPIEPTVSLCLILDPMLATGGSAVATVDILKRWGVRRVKFVGLIGAPEGIQKMQSHHLDVPIHLAAIDQRLNEVGYILPGLGDAGDRQFGTA